MLFAITAGPYFHNFMFTTMPLEAKPFRSELSITHRPRSKTLTVRGIGWLVGSGLSNLKKGHVGGQGKQCQTNIQRMELRIQAAP